MSSNENRIINSYWLINSSYKQLLKGPDTAFFQKAEQLKALTLKVTNKFVAIVFFWNLSENQVFIRQLYQAI